MNAKRKRRQRRQGWVPPDDVGWKRLTIALYRRKGFIREWERARSERRADLVAALDEIAEQIE